MTEVGFPQSFLYTKPVYVHSSRKIAGLLDDPGEEEGTPSCAQELQQEGGSTDGL